MPEPTEKPDDLSTAAGICAGVAWGSIFCSLVPMVGCLATPVGGLTALAAMVLGLVGLVRAGTGPSPGRLWAIGGLVGGATWLLAMGALVAYVLHEPGAGGLRDVFRHTSH